MHAKSLFDKNKPSSSRWIPVSKNVLFDSFFFYALWGYDAMQQTFQMTLVIYDFGEYPWMYFMMRYFQCLKFTRHVTAAIAYANSERFSRENLTRLKEAVDRR